MFLLFLAHWTGLAGLDGEATHEKTKGGLAFTKKKLEDNHRKDKLVGGLEHVLFFHILGIVIPIDFLLFFRGVGIPPTR